MSKEDEYNNKLWRRLEDMYPYGYAMARTIAIKFTQIHNDILPDSDLKPGENKILAFEVGLDHNGNPTLAVSPSSMILFVAIAESILELIMKRVNSGKNLEELEKGFILENKICGNPKCGEVNKVTAKFCDTCGYEFEK
jgi:hypothetical protein